MINIVSVAKGLEVFKELNFNMESVVASALFTLPLNHCFFKDGHLLAWYSLPRQLKHMFSFCNCCSLQDKSDDPLSQLWYYSYYLEKSKLAALVSHLEQYIYSMTAMWDRAWLIRIFGLK